ncbi:spermatogenesis-associated protein 24 isoform X5 [Pongo pygmaeus]|uniref:spermatogenesis-associated protein 24 isoform X5 n=1 Tax=Pongo pygmaeus TaxID=9600 RepID=UPI0023E1812D|nr:spermatogenesis-associated protein 24 isoform X5 [Pongo pygmaeus]XP_054412598.1 spermatogenesis-associated protein 24 isoform X5 [Pongo abelii]
MATPLGWSKAGSGSVCLAFDQLRDVIESQEELIHQLRNVVPRVSSCYPLLVLVPRGRPFYSSPRPSLSQALLQMVLQDENFVSKEEFQAVEKKLVEEKAAHAKTKVLLAKEEEKLQFALGEVEVLSKQLEKEKLAFEKALSSVKSKVLQESSKKDQLITKCNDEREFLQGGNICKDLQELRAGASHLPAFGQDCPPLSKDLLLPSCGSSGPE